MDAQRIRQKKSSHEAKSRYVSNDTRNGLENVKGSINEHSADF